jgi:hypothetical protein
MGTHPFNEAQGGVPQSLSPSSTFRRVTFRKLEK